MDEHEQIYEQLSKPPRQPRIKADVTATPLSSIPDLYDPAGRAAQIEPSTMGMRLWQNVSDAWDSQTGRLLRAVGSYLPFASEGFAAARGTKALPKASAIFEAMMGAGRDPAAVEEALKNAPSAISLFQKPLLTKAGAMKWAPDPAEMLSSGKVQDVAGFDQWLANVEKQTSLFPEGHARLSAKEVQNFWDRQYPVDWKHPQRSTTENPLIPASEPGGYTAVEDAQKALQRMKRIEGKMNESLRGVFMREDKVEATGLRNVDRVANLLNYIKKAKESRQ
jgi:hypothetical protein